VEGEEKKSARNEFLIFKIRTRYFHMKPKKPPNPLRRFHDAWGFTLLEALIAVAILGLVGTAVSALYASGSRSVDESIDRMLLDSRLRSRMEFLISTDFASLSNGSESVTVNGQNYTITWSVAAIDLDGDAIPESDAKQVTVVISELPERYLTVLIVDCGDKVKKIS
jgi:hypothetical protein